MDRGVIESSDGQSRKRPRKGYVRPELTEYGPVEKLTQSGGITTHDGGGNRKPGA